MRTSRSSTALSVTTVLLLASCTKAQNAAAGGGGGPNLPPPSQYPVVNVGPSLLTVGGTTSAVNGPFTQTFVTPLGTWAFATPSVGSVGLGTIQGSVGNVKGGRK